jgi:hypothetical protein
MNVVRVISWNEHCELCNAHAPCYAEVDLPGYITYNIPCGCAYGTYDDGTPASPLTPEQITLALLMWEGTE